MTDRVPEIEEAMLERVRGLAARDDVARAMSICKEQVAEAMAEQVKIAEIESPTFAEKVRGEAVMELMRSYGLTDVVMDPSGNVVGRRPGTGSGPTLAIAAHLDTVFPAGTDLTVRREAGRRRRKDRQT